MAKQGSKGTAWSPVVIPSFDWKVYDNQVVRLLHSQSWDEKIFPDIAAHPWLGNITGLIDILLGIFRLSTTVLCRSLPQVTVEALPAALALQNMPQNSKATDLRRALKISTTQCTFRKITATQIGMYLPTLTRTTPFGTKSGRNTRESLEVDNVHESFSARF
ncbi:hypothetical protein BDV40DRAFT_211683 [Aspergillus tamarii]|uniref:Uncharacterized protein n=1 Tax=Aspergillus tamarii TaxID=41984 RepID=A0A5N6UPY7_ASPTM|nr:hypothetical protein BDV40DRAFT_211683 [Aspergillus tamarii]